MSLPDNNERWRETADEATRRQYPDEYWCVADNGWVQYFWAEQTVSREEYLANSGKPECSCKMIKISSKREGARVVYVMRNRCDGEGGV